MPIVMGSQVLRLNPGLCDGKFSRLMHTPQSRLAIAPPHVPCAPEQLPVQPVIIALLLTSRRDILYQGL